MCLEDLRIWRPERAVTYETAYVSVYVPKRDITLTYRCRADVLEGDMVHVTIREEVADYDWRPIHHIGEVLKILDEEDVVNLRNKIWFEDTKLAIVCGREKEEPMDGWKELDDHLLKTHSEQIEF